MTTSASDIETVRRGGIFIEVESSEEDAEEFYAALKRIEDALNHKCCGCPHRKAVTDQR